MKQTVLVVEDERDHRTVARLTLRLGGYEVWEASSGEEALAALTTRLPHVVVLDIRLPGIDGLEVVARMRCSDQFAAVPVLLCSAHASAPWSSVARTDPYTNFLAKPFHPDHLLAALANILSTSPSPARS